MAAASWTRWCLNRHLKETANPLLPPLDLISLLFVDAGSQTLLTAFMAAASWTRRCLNRHLKETANLLLYRVKRGMHKGFIVPASNFPGLKPAIRKPGFSGLNPYRTRRKKMRVFIRIREGELASWSGTGNAKHGPGPRFCHP
ncbi:hypothetical protein WN944_029607 [Citrus x changshan-huyou]|uniref:Uncharacterized protein n=1 Tax=Citrus x changshan-huyou TaxID=2935761 RepID=A0AAP0LSV3_9ROSI